MNFTKMQQQSKTTKGKSGRTKTIPAAGRNLEHCARKAGDRARGNETIDPSKTHLNYDLADELRGGLTAVNYFHKKLDKAKQDFREKNNKELRKDCVVLCSWVVTVPKDLPEEYHNEFFRECYAWLTETYGKENVVQAAVHLDETTPHIHLEFMPFVEDKDKGGVKLCAKNLETPTTLRKIHSELQERLTEKLGCEVKLLNGATEGGNKTINELKAEKAEKKATAAEKKVAASNSSLNNLLDSIPPLVLNPMPEKKPLPEKYQSQNEPIDIYPNYSRKSKNFDKVHSKWEKERDKALAKIDEEWEKECAAVKAQNELIRQEWERKYLTPDNLSKAQSMVERDKALTAKARSDAEAYVSETRTLRNAVSEKIKNLDSEVEQRAQALTDKRMQEMFNGAPTAREKRLEAFCDKVRFNDVSSVLDAFIEQEETLKKGKFKGR